MGGIFVCGITGSGKTYWAARKFKNLPTAYRAVFVNTQFENYFPDTQCTTAPPPFLPQNHIVWNIENETQFYQWLTGLFRAVRVSRQLPRWYYIFVDEADLYADRFTIPQPVRSLATRGRRFNLIPVWITQRPQMTHADLISQADTFVFFRCWEKDYEYFRREWRIDLANYYNHLLRPYHYVIFRGGTYYAA